MLWSKLGPQERTEDFVVNKGAIVPSRKDYYNETTMDELELPLFDFRTLAMATNNFSDTNKLGQGGFGCVYKVNYFYIWTFKISCLKVSDSKIWSKNLNILNHPKNQMIIFRNFLYTDYLKYLKI